MASYIRSKTTKIIKYKKYTIKVKKEGDCYIFRPNSKECLTWAENLASAKGWVRIDLECIKLNDSWDIEGKAS